MQPNEIAGFVEAEDRVLRADLGPDDVFEAKVTNALRNLTPGGGGATPRPLKLAAAAAFIIVAWAVANALSPTAVPTAEVGSTTVALSLESVPLPAAPQEGRGSSPSEPTISTARPAAPQMEAAQTQSERAHFTAQRAAEPTNRANEELEAYDRAQAMLRDARYPEAVDAFRGFLDRFPHGTLVKEARFSLLDATYRSGRFDDVVVLAETLLADESALRRGDIARLQGDALVKLGKCGTAAFAYRDAVTLGARSLTQANIDAALFTCENGPR